MVGSLNYLYILNSANHHIIFKNFFICILRSRKRSRSKHRSRSKSKGRAPKFVLFQEYIYLYVYIYYIDHALLFWTQYTNHLNSFWNSVTNMKKECTQLQLLKNLFGMLIWCENVKSLVRFKCILYPWSNGKTWSNTEKLVLKNLLFKKILRWKSAVFIYCIFSFVRVDKNTY